MRDDLLDAKAAVDWAEAQIPILQERLMNWQRERPYEIVPEPDPADKNWEFLVAYLGIPLDPLIHGDVGAIINSARTALDILMSALLAGHGIKPNSKAHFPIRKARTDFLAAVTAKAAHSPAVTREHSGVSPPIPPAASITRAILSMGEDIGLGFVARGRK
jgi:hypothetical protein